MTSHVIAAPTDDRVLIPFTRAKRNTATQLTPASCNSILVDLMDCGEPYQRADRLVALLDGVPLVVPSAWDPGSARLLERAGARAIGIQLDDIGWSLGHASWTSAPDEVVAACVRTCRTVIHVPVIADLSTASESSIVGEPHGLANVLRLLIAGGVAGVTVAGDAMVDGRIPRENLLASVTRSAGARLYVEARVDPPVIDIEAGGRSQQRQYNEMLQLARACAAAGAEGALVSGCYAAEAVRLVRDVPLPVSIDVSQGWAAPVHVFARAGVRSVRLGHGPLRAALGLMKGVVAEALERGSYDLMNRHMSRSAGARRPA
jgi:2-methylisocitrate lyase-like PEP mutase family enzyme